MSQGTLVKRQFGHRARLALSPAGIRAADDQAHAARTMWNLLHAWWQMMPKEKRTLAHADAAIRQARKDIDFLAVLPAQAAQAVLKTYVQAWKNCWDGRADAPNFKGRLRTVMSVDIPQGRDLNITRVHRRWGMVNLPKVGRVRFRWTKDLPVGKRADTENRITGARLVKDALGWHIAFRVQTLEPRPDPHQGPDIGIDVGVTVPIALSNGETYGHGAWLTEKEKARLLHLEQRAAQRKQHRRPGERTSRRLHHTYDQIAELRAKAKRRALDWQHKTTTAIARPYVRTYGTVVVEALTLTNMVKSARGTVEEPGKNVAQKSGLNRSISQEAWGRTVTMLAYKTAQLGGTLVKVPAPGTSRRCSACGFTTPGSRESQAVFVCKNPDCGWSGNAARNVLHLYRTSLALVPAAGRAVVRRAKRVKPAAAR
ncbi:RNA-guided endonuclease InsQ/TnpB family protein [Streptomyces caniscabiei]|uniref:Transposase n=1 Tax=Streptomyces caniscabiei TaxID=2746961 RepID=A0ABU4MPR9_9ACTN|nr:RNA-guided endonuclease TnpB family protein [Streptomyces caniscabiei]MBE4737881.1 transposase [Streptomyces caniscabiei]MBE4757320.1 transposase [Streptomyces caniscabiei]MBE4784960.1 transposase [Streptomyces caniscabiei]MBE4795744.1 transposase [Streptomyces caniscabiei]MDX2945864.1 transposase [Streptomyces caniscabiei]